MEHHGAIMQWTHGPHVFMLRTWHMGAGSWIQHGAWNRSWNRFKWSWNWSWNWSWLTHGTMFDWIVTRIRNVCWSVAYAWKQFTHVHNVESCSFVKIRISANSNLENVVLAELKRYENTRVWTRALCVIVLIAFLLRFAFSHLQARKFEVCASLWMITPASNSDGGQTWTIHLFFHIGNTRNNLCWLLFKHRQLHRTATAIYLVSEKYADMYGGGIPTHLRKKYTRLYIKNIQYTA